MEHTLEDTFNDFFGFRHTTETAAEEQAAIRDELSRVEQLRERYPQPSVYLSSDARSAGVPRRYLKGTGRFTDYGEIHGFNESEINESKAKLEKTPQQYADEWNKARDAFDD